MGYARRPRVAQTCRRVAMALLALASHAPRAQEGPAQQVLITAPSARDAMPFGHRVGREPLDRARAAAGDSARLLQDVPGISLYGAGGVSSLPALHGLADDRLRTQVDGMDLVAACPNHMNSPLSYLDPQQVGSVQVYAGVTPVSVGGDSLGGTIQMESAPPEYADGEAPWLASGRVSAFHRTNGNGHGGSAAASLATERLAFSVHGAQNRQDDYRAARAFKPVAPGTEGGADIPGDVVGSSAYASRNLDLSLALREGDHEVQLKLGRQHLGFEGFPNQRMDMTGNRGTQANLRYSGRLAWGRLSARLWQQRVRHEMDMGPDRYRYGYGMPMDTEATTRGAFVQAEVPTGEADLVRVGAERQTYVLYDWWPPVGGAMGPQAFWNVDDGQRRRGAAFAEWELHPTPQWLALAGLRAERVTTDAGPVQGYDNTLGAIWGREAAAFNALQRRRVDHNVDASLLARWAPDAGHVFEGGLARKAHSPNLYQRYAWSTQPMAALMNNFVGDGNGYIGQPDLRPEVAHTLALSAEGHDADNPAAWSLKATAYVTRVHDYIDARRCDFGQCSAANVGAGQGFVLLQYVNQEARLTGLDLSGQGTLATTGDGTLWTAAFALSQVSGRNLDTGEGVYNIMPLNLRSSLQAQRGAWTAVAEFQAVDGKSRLSAVRNEMPTAGYVLVNLKASWDEGALRVDLGVDNLFNRAHTPPLGGAYLGQGRSMTSAGIPWGTTVPGAARSLYAALQLRY